MHARFPSASRCLPPFLAFTLACGAPTPEASGPAQPVARPVPSEWAPSRWLPRFSYPPDVELARVAALVQAAVPGPDGLLPPPGSAIIEESNSVEVVHPGDRTPGVWEVYWRTASGGAYVAHVDLNRDAARVEPASAADIARRAAAAAKLEGWSRDLEAHRIPGGWDAEGVHRVAEALEDSTLRSAALQAILDLDRAALPPDTPLPDAVGRGLVRLTRSPSTSVRADAVYVIGHSGDASLLPAVAEAPCDPAPQVRFAAVSGQGLWWTRAQLSPWLVDADAAVAARAASRWYGAGADPWEPVPAAWEGYADASVPEVDDAARDWTAPWSTRVGPHLDPKRGIQPVIAPKLDAAMRAGPGCAPRKGAYTLRLWSPAVSKGVTVELRDAAGTVVGSGVAGPDPDWSTKLEIEVTGPPTDVRLRVDGAEEVVALSPAREDQALAFCGMPAAPPSPPDGEGILWDTAPAACVDRLLEHFEDLPLSSAGPILRRMDPERAAATFARWAHRPAQDRQTLLMRRLDGRTLAPEDCDWVVRVALRDGYTGLGSAARACGEADPELGLVIATAVVRDHWPANGVVRLLRPENKPVLLRIAVEEALETGSERAIGLLPALSGVDRQGVLPVEPPIGEVAGLLLLRDGCRSGAEHPSFAGDVVVLAATEAEKPLVVPLTRPQRDTLHAAVCADGRLRWRRR